MRRVYISRMLAARTPYVGGGGSPVVPPEPKPFFSADYMTDELGRYTSDESGAKYIAVE